MTLDSQVKVSTMLGCSFAFTLITLGGAGSLLALILGLRARRIIKQSNGEIAEIRMAWRCIILRGIELVVIPADLIWLLIKAFQ